MCRSKRGTQSAILEEPMNIPVSPAENTSEEPVSETLPEDLEEDTLPPLFGDPDWVPQYTFIAAPRDQDNDFAFLNLAIEFHRNSGLVIFIVESIEEIVEILTNDDQTGAGIINRIRIVSHVFVDQTGIVAPPTNMLINFLTNGSRLTLRRYFNGFIKSPLEALKSMLTFSIGTFDNTTYYINTDSAKTLMDYLRPNLDSILSTIPVNGLGEPEGDFNDFFKICGSLWVLERNAIPGLNNAQSNVIKESYEFLLANVKDSIKDIVSEINLNIIQNELISIEDSPQNPSPSWNSPATGSQIDLYVQNIRATLEVISNGTFFSNIVKVQQRFDQYSKIDIRGCQVGRDLDFLRSVKSFFTNPTHQRSPVVSGPRWFQHFNEMGFRSCRNNQEVELFYNNGRSPYSGSQIRIGLFRDFFEQWASSFGITAAHLNFWRNTFSLNVLLFSSLNWRNNIPQTTIPINILGRLPNATFRDLMTHIAQIFLVPSNERPNENILNHINSLSLDIDELIIKLDASIPNNANDIQLTEHFDNFRDIYILIDRRFEGVGSPPPADQQIIPPTIPGSFTVQTIRDFQSQLQTFIETDANSFFHPIRSFLDFLINRTNDAPSLMRYFLGLGLPFLAYDAQANQANNNFIVVFQDQTGNNRREDDAIRYWIRSQWRGIIPDDMGGDTAFEDSRHTPWLVENRQPTTVMNTPPFVVSPTPEYQEQIVAI